METVIGMVTWKLSTIKHAYDTSEAVENKDDMIQLITWVKKQYIRVLNLNT